jgi:aspartyl/asparaginyl-tRNA synthetase
VGEASVRATMRTYEKSKSVGFVQLRDTCARYLRLRISDIARANADSAHVKALALEMSVKVAGILGIPLGGLKRDLKK